MKQKIRQPSEQELYYRRQNTKLEKRKEFWFDLFLLIKGVLLIVLLILITFSIFGGVISFFTWKDYATKKEQEKIRKRIDILEANQPLTIRYYTNQILLH